MAGRSFNRWWLSTVLGLCLLQVLVALVADPYCVYGIIRYPKRNFEPNTRFLKIEYLRAHPAYDAFILGSSRAGFYDAPAAERLCGRGERYFNLNASLENGEGIRRKLEWLLNSRPVRQVIVNVDFDLQSVGNDPFDLLRQDHPDVSRVPHLSFYAKYLLFQPRILYLYVSANLTEPKGEPWNDGNSALNDPLYVPRPFFDSARLYQVTLGAVRRDLAAAGHARDRSAGAGIEEFGRTVALLDRAGIEHILIIPPYRLDQFASFHPDALAEWLRKVVAAGGSVWDFAGYNAVTANPANYVDPIHFDGATGERILQRVCGIGNTTDEPGDFGVRVTPANLEEHIENLRRQHALAGERAPLIDWNRP